MRKNVTPSKRDAFRTERRAWGVVEVATLLGVSPAFIRLEIQRGKIATLRIGRRVLIASATLDAYIANAARNIA